MKGIRDHEIVHFCEFQKARSTNVRPTEPKFSGDSWPVLVGASTYLGVPIAENDQDVFPRGVLDSFVERQVEVLYFLSVWSDVAA